MALVLAEAVVTVSADGKAIPKKVANDVASNGAPMKGAGAGLAKTFLAGFGGILGGAAVLKGVGWFKGAIDGASDMNETASKASAIFGDQTAALEKWSSRAALNLGLSSQSALDSATSFGDMFTQIGFTGEAAAGMSKDVVQAAADLGSFSNLETADVADRMSAAFRGEYDSLQAVIPNINAARVESEALAATGKKAAKELTAQEKAAAVLAIVHKDGARAMGDFAKTSDGFANSQKIATASLDDMQAKVGTALLPVMNGFMSLLLDSIIPALSDMAGWFTDNIEMIKQIAIVVGVMVGAFAALSIGVAIYSGIRSTLTAITLAGSVAQWALNSALFASPITWIIAGIALLIGALVLLVMNWDTVVTFITGVWGGFIDWLTVVMDGLLSWWGGVWAGFLGFISPVTDTIGAIFTWLYDMIFVPVFTGIMIYIGLWAALFTWLWSTVLSPIIGFISVGFQAVGAVIGWLWNNAVMPAVEGIGAGFSWLWANAISPVVGFISAAIEAVGAVIGWLWNNAVMPAIDGISAGFSWLWTNGIMPVVDFISDAMQSVGDTIHDVFGGIADFIGDAFNTVLGVVRGPINGLIGMINGMISNLNGISVTIPDWIPGVGGQTFGLSIPKIPLLAKGGTLADNGSFIAGENGPELISGVKGATVHPYSATKAMASRGGDTIIKIGSVVLDAKNVKEFGDVVELIKALPQVARTGRGTAGVA